MRSPSTLPEAEQKFLKEQWLLLTGSEQYEEALALYCKDPEKYEPPLLPWVVQNAGRSLQQLTQLNGLLGVSRGKDGLKRSGA